MNKRGNIIFGLMIFLMGLAVMVMFISPINDMIDIAQQSDNMNCKGFIYDGNVNATLSYNSTLDGGNSGSPLGCLAIKLYLPYLLLIFLVGGIARVLAGKGAEMFGIPSDQYE